VDTYAAVNQAIGGQTTPPGGGDDATVLSNGVAVTGVSGNAGDQQLYKIDVPAGARALVLRTFGGTGDVSLYVKSGSAPTTTSFDASSVHVGNSESYVTAKPATSTYYVLVVGAGNFANVTVQATYAAAP
jgi:serine protease